MARLLALFAPLLVVGNGGCGHSTCRPSAVAAYPTTGATVATHGPVEGLPECEGLAYSEMTQSVLGKATSTRNLARHEGDDGAIVPTGIAVTVPMERGHDAAYVHRVLACQSAQARQPGASVASSPLGVAGTRARIVPRNGQYEIQLVNDDPALAREVQLRMVDGAR